MWACVFTLCSVHECVSWGWLCDYLWEMRAFVVVRGSKLSPLPTCAASPLSSFFFSSFWQGDHSKDTLGNAHCIFHIWRDISSRLLIAVFIPAGVQREALVSSIHRLFIYLFIFPLPLPPLDTRAPVRLATSFAAQLHKQQRRQYTYEGRPFSFCQAAINRARGASGLSV